MKTIALILAGGRGTRFTENKAKQYYSLAGRPIIVHSIEAFSSHKLITETRVVIHPQDMKAYNEAISIFTTGENIIGVFVLLFSVVLMLFTLKFGWRLIHRKRYINPILLGIIFFFALFINLNTKDVTLNSLIILL